MNTFENIQNKVRWNTPADSLRLMIEQLDQLDSKTKNSYVRYWKAYACYLLASIYHNKRANDSEQLISKGIETLKKIDNRNSDQYALLSLLEGLELSFINKLLIPFKAKTVEKDAQKAIDLDPENCRAYLAMGTYDFYVPKAFGGQKICETMLKKALSLRASTDSNPYSPTWGGINAYCLLVTLYSKGEKPELAIPYIKEGYAKYPASPYLKEMYAKLVKN